MASGIEVILDGDGCWPDLKNREVISVGEGVITPLAVLERGTANGKQSIAFRIDLDDKKTAVLQFTANTFIQAAALIGMKVTGEGDPGCVHCQLFHIIRGMMEMMGADHAQILTGLRQVVCQFIGAMGKESERAMSEFLEGLVEEMRVNRKDMDEKRAQLRGGLH